MIRGNFADVLDPSVRRIFDDVYSSHPTEYTEVFNVLTSEKSNETDSSVSGIPPAEDMSEAAEIPYADAVQGFDVTYVHGKIGRGITITYELVEDDQFRVIGNKAAGLAKAVNLKVEADAVDIFNSGFAGGVAGGDGEQLFSDTHVREDGGAGGVDNRGTAALDENTLFDQTIQMNDVLGPVGEEIVIVPDMLIAPAELEKQSRIILESTGRPSTNENDINVHMGSLDLFIWHYLSDIDNWFLLDRSESQLNFFWRRSPQIRRDDKVSAEIARWYVTARFSVGFSDWRAVNGSLV